MNAFVEKIIRKLARDCVSYEIRSSAKCFADSGTNVRSRTDMKYLLAYLKSVEIYGVSYIHLSFCRSDKLVMITLYYDETKKQIRFRFIVGKKGKMFNSLFFHDDKTNMFLMGCKENPKKYIDEKDLYKTVMKIYREY